jgi:hypothetical protein
MTTTTAELEKKLLVLLLDLAIFAHKDKLEREGEYEYLPDEHSERLSVDFNESTMLNYNGMKVTPSGGTYWLRFKAIGKLKSELLSAGMPYTFTVLLVNEKFRKSMWIDKDLDFQKKFVMAVFESRRKGVTDAAKISRAISNLEKLSLPLRIKFP